MNIIEYIDQDYAGHGLQSQKLYLAVPKHGIASASSIPVVVYIHGGGWIGGNFAAGARGLATERADAAAFLEAGYAVAIINYRLSTEAKWTAQIHDCKAAIRFLRANAARYGIDPERIVAWGASAGAHLAQFMGLTNDDLRYEGPATAFPEANRASSRVNLVISAFGIADIARWALPGSRNLEVEGYKSMLLGDHYTEAQAKDASPIERIDALAPGSMVPMLLMHADNDDLVPCEQTHWLEQRLRDAGYGDRIETWYPHIGGHGDPAVWRSPAATSRFVSFCDRHLDATTESDLLRAISLGLGSAA
ncbi:alpha/beta hydrolase [Bifidobacterium cebidarum]|uniref:Peptidase S9 n=1 Tax=Bifidobacterium cebidarum TaxID=2650773 RepID=A0A6I1GHC1_9BIFI|nr:alpha/beta hydrolase [Bifidobacterium cebidarum]KAB7788779.1 peptidase S9 [Bifidobacterium cebidarum]